MRVALLLLAACSAAQSSDPSRIPLEPPRPDVQVALASFRFPPRLHVRFHEVETIPGKPVRELDREETLLPLLLEDTGALVLREVVTGDLTWGEVYFTPSGGVGHVGAWDEKLATYGAYAPRQAILPDNPSVGVRWSASHSLGARLVSNLRECEVKTMTACKGLSSHCVSQRTSGMVLDVRIDFCDGVGWVGEEDIIYRDGALRIHIIDDRVIDVP